MRKLNDFPLVSTANNNDLLLLWDNEASVTKAIKKGDLLAGAGGGSGSGLAGWVLINSNHVATHGNRLLIDTSASPVQLTLPSEPNFGDEIDICGIKGTKTNIVSIDLSETLFKGAKPRQLNYSSLFLPAKLIYTTSDIGWFNPDGLILAAGNYPQEVLADLPYCYLRLDDRSGAVAIDASINNRDCQYQGTVQYNQESSLNYDLENKSIGFNGSNTRIIINPNINTPSAYTLECRFKTVAPNGGLFGFSGGGYDRDLYLVNGQLRLLNFNGATITSSGIFNDNEWHTVTTSTGSRGADIWVDGTLAASSSNGNTVSYSGNWFVGYGQYGGYFNGLIDEASIHHTQLSVDRIKARHNSV